MIKGIKQEIDYTTGIQQGENIFPPLFMYMMQKAMEMFKKEDKERKKPELKSLPNLKGHEPTSYKALRSTKIFNMSDVLFIDDTTLVCETREDIKEVSQ